jgi:hypothetical protein
VNKTERSERKKEEDTRRQKKGERKGKVCRSWIADWSNERACSMNFRPASV